MISSVGPAAAGHTPVPSADGWGVAETARLASRTRAVLLGDRDLAPRSGDERRGSERIKRREGAGEGRGAVRGFASARCRSAVEATAKLESPEPATKAGPRPIILETALSLTTDRAGAGFP